MSRAEELREEIATINARLTALDDERRHLCKTRRAVDMELVKLEYGVEVGSVVRGRDGKLYKVTTVEERASWRSEGKPWVSGNPERKDGAFGTAHRKLFDYWTTEGVGR